MHLLALKAIVSLFVTKFVTIVCHIGKSTFSEKLYKEPLGGKVSSNYPSISQVLNVHGKIKAECFRI